MKGAIFYASKYGSTAQYAQWISEATKLPVFNIDDGDANPDAFDFLILGSPIIYFKLRKHKWFKQNWSLMANKPILFFSVSGAPAGEKLNGWIRDSLPEAFITHMEHVALQGRQIPTELTWFDRMNLKVAGLFNKDPKARKDEMQGFDYMDQASIQPIVDWVAMLEQKPEAVWD